MGSEYFIKKLEGTGHGLSRIELENERLSLSNAYALNRGVFTFDQVTKVIGE